jgi:hypothetical protein
MPYPLGWPVLTQAVVRRERWPGGYRTSAVALVYPGQMVEPDQPVIRLKQAERSEEISGLPRLSLPSTSQKLPTVRPGVAGASEARVAARSGTGDTDAALAVPALGEETVPAGLRGRVLDVTARGGVVIESRVMALRGALGAGRQVAGIVTLWSPSGLQEARSGLHPPGAAGAQRIPPGAILVVPGPLNFVLLRHALNSGVVGVIASSIFLRDLEGFLHADLLEVMTSPNSEAVQSRLPPLTIMLTEGLGSLAMPARVMRVLSRYQGRIALLSGATSTKEHLLPELLISLAPGESEEEACSRETGLSLGPGARVRLCAGDYHGRIGEIAHLCVHRQLLPSGVRARSACVRLDEGELILAALASLERIG